MRWLGLRVPLANGDASVERSGGEEPKRVHRVYESRRPGANAIILDCLWTYGLRYNSLLRVQAWRANYGYYINRSR